MLNAPHSILSVWKKFDRFPMETLTKAWFYDKAGIKKQREVSLMKEHHDQYGITGNCFDLASGFFMNLSRLESMPIRLATN